MQAFTRGMALLAWGCVALAAVACRAHPTHVSLGEAQWNPVSHCLEVSERLIAEHLEDAVRKFSGEDAFRLDRAGAESVIRDYVKSRFQVTRDASKSVACELKWVGMELKTQEAWLYFEIRLPSDWQAIVMRNSLLFDVVPQQTNLVSVSADGETTTLVFSPDHLERTLRRSDAASSRGPKSATHDQQD